MDKQVYYKRRWQPCEFHSQKGEYITVILDGLEVEAPYQDVRELKPKCLECKKKIFKASYQTHSGESICRHCYDKLDQQDIEFYFRHPQWLSWDGQISIADMDDQHLAASLMMLEKRATKIAELTHGTVQEYLPREFEFLVSELRRRVPEERVRVNHFLLYIWTLFYTIFGARRENS